MAHEDEPSDIAGFFASMGAQGEVSRSDRPRGKGRESSPKFATTVGPTCGSARERVHL
jgi:hypothetical protein